MAERINKIGNDTLWIGLSILLSGLCVGWMVGLSITPLLQTILISLLAVIIAVTSVLVALSFISREDGTPRTTRLGVNPVPVMLLVVGLVIGWSTGVYARTNLWLGPRAQSLSERTGLTAQEINKRAFEQVYPPPTLRADPGGVATVSTTETRSVTMPSPVMGGAGENRNIALPSPAPGIGIANSNVTVPPAVIGSASENRNIMVTPTPVPTPNRATLSSNRYQRMVPPPRPRSTVRTAPSPTPTPAAVAGLVNLQIKVSDCKALESLEGESLRRNLSAQTDPTVRAFVNRVSDANVLKVFVEEVLCSASR